MLAGFVLVVTFTNLLFDFFRHHVDRRVKVTFAIFGEQVRPTDPQADRAGKLALGRPGMIVFERHARVDGEPVQMLQFVDPAENVVFNGLGQRHIMRRKDKLHEAIMCPDENKIQRNHQVHGGTKRSHDFEFDLWLKNF